MWRTDPSWVRKVFHELRTPSWAWVQEALSSSTRVCEFDRACPGWSGAARGSQDGHELACDLHGLLQAAGIEPSHVLAGDSVGGAYALAMRIGIPGKLPGSL